MASGRIIVAEISKPEDVERVLNEAFARAGYKVGGDLPEGSASVVPEQPSEEKRTVPYDELVALLEANSKRDDDTWSRCYETAVKALSERAIDISILYTLEACRYDGVQASTKQILDEVKAKWGLKA